LWIGQALLLGRQSSEAEIAFDRTLQLDLNSPSTKEMRSLPGSRLATLAAASRIWRKRLRSIHFICRPLGRMSARIERYADSALGLNPTRIDYSDYREVDGVKISFQRRVCTAKGVSVIELKQIRQNVPIPAGTFAVVEKEKQ
jgi:hypothetical protein